MRTLLTHGSLFDLANNFWAWDQAMERAPENNRQASRPKFTFAPAADVAETPTHFVLSLDMPGVPKDSIKIESVKDELVVSGERKTEHSADVKGLIAERSEGTYYRAFSLNVPVEVEKIEAVYQDGVLKIAIPKAEATKPRLVPVKDSSAGGLFDQKPEVKAMH